MKKCCALFLITVFLLLPVFSLSSCEKKVETYTFTGVVTYFEAEGLSRFVFVRPQDREESDAPWIPFEINADTKMGSYYLADDVASVPEYQIGSTVEIVYKATDHANKLYPRRKFAAVSIKAIDPSSANTSVQDSPLRINEAYDPSYVLAEDIINDYQPTIVHIAKLESPRTGYLIYSKSNKTTSGYLVCYWLDENAAAIEDGILEDLESGNTDIDVYMDILVGEDLRPFEDLNVFYIWIIGYRK